MSVNTVYNIIKVAVSHNVASCKYHPWTIFKGQMNSSHLQGYCQPNDIEEA